MSTLAQILITVVLVAAGVAGYHFVAAEGGADGDVGATYTADSRALADLQRRLDAIEGDGARLDGLPAETRLAMVVAELDARITALEARAPSRTSRPGATTEERALEIEGASGAAYDEGEGELLAGASDLSKAQQKRIRDIVQSEISARNSRRGQEALNRRLERLGLELNDEQKAKVGEALTTHYQAVGEKMRELRDEGLPREDIRKEIRGFNDGLTETLSTFLPAADAEAITKSMTQRRSRGPGGGGGGQRR
jgi:hypothetical protein